MLLASLPKIAFRTVLAIFCANFVTMLAMNVFRLPAGSQPWLYFSAGRHLLVGCGAVHFSNERPD